MRSVAARRAGAETTPNVAALLADEVQAVEIAVVTAANRTFEFHGTNLLKGYTIVSVAPSGISTG